MDLFYWCSGTPIITRSSGTATMTVFSWSSLFPSILDGITGSFLIKLDSRSSLIAYYCCYAVAFTAVLWRAYLNESEREPFSALLKKLIHLLKHAH